MVRAEIQNVKLRFGIIGNNENLNRAIDIAIQVAPTDLSVLVTGESGVGKESFPQIIHQFSRRKHGPYIAVNCGAIPEGTIDSELDATDASVFADEMHLTNVIFNLMDNAVKYKRPDVDLHLLVKTWNEQGKLMISVQDNGIGIKKENLKKIFDKFYRVHTGNLHDVKGFGLGLAYVKKIITDHKGTIRAESEPNVGTKFIIALPLFKN